MMSEEIDLLEQLILMVNEIHKDIKGLQEDVKDLHEIIIDSNKELLSMNRNLDEANMTLSGIERKTGHWIKDYWGKLEEVNTFCSSDNIIN